MALLGLGGGLPFELIERTVAAAGEAHRPATATPAREVETWRRKS